MSPRQTAFLTSGCDDKSSGQTICTATAARRVVPREGHNERAGLLMCAGVTMEESADSLGWPCYKAICLLHPRNITQAITCFHSTPGKCGLRWPVVPVTGRVSTINRRNGRDIY